MPRPIRHASYTLLTSSMTICPKFYYVTFIKKNRRCESLSPMVILLKQKHSITKRYVSNKGHIYNFIVRFMYLNIIKFSQVRNVKCF